jgi:tuberous sclerosis 2
VLRRCWDAVADLFAPPQLSPTSGAVSVTNASTAPGSPAGTPSLRSVPPDALRSAFRVMAALLECHYEHLETLKFEFFNAISRMPESVPWRVEALSLLTRDGRDLFPFAHDIGVLTVRWLRESLSEIKAALSSATPASAAIATASTTMTTLLPLLLLLDKIVRYNFTVFDENTKAATIHVVCEICNSAQKVELIQSSLAIFETVVAYAGPMIPSIALTPLLSALCRTMNIDAFSQQSWHITAHLLSGQSGHQGLRALCAILDDPASYKFVSLLRGAVFFVSMSVWGSQRVENLKRVSAVTVLPSLLRAVRGSGHSIVAYEVLLGLKRLIKKYGPQLRVEWSIICEILLSFSSFLVDTTAEVVDNSFIAVLRDILSTIEELYQKRLLLADDQLIFDLLGAFAPYLNESTALFLLQIQREQKLSPVSSSDWLLSLKEFIITFFNNHDLSRNVRVRCLQSVSEIFAAQASLFAEEMVEHALLPGFRSAYKDADQTLAIAAIDFLLSDVAPHLSRLQTFELLVDYFIALLAVRPEWDAPREIKHHVVAALVRLFADIFPTKYFSRVVRCGYLLPSPRFL